MSTDDTRPLSRTTGDGPDPAHPAPGAEPTPATTPPYGPAPVYRRGPAPFALFIGLLGLVVAAAVLLTEVADISIPWSGLGPWVVVGGGLLVVLVGLLGLRANRPQD